MKLLKLLIFFSFISCTNIIIGQCPNNLFLVTQADVDDFIQLYPNCTEINGDVRIGAVNPVIESSDISNLEVLSQITSIGGHFYIRNTPLLTNLEGLENLNSIGEIVFISDNEVLTTLSGLGAITSIGENLSISDNPVLNDITALGSITSIGRSIYIQYNNSLKNLANFSNITSLRELSISNNDSLVIINGFDNLSSIERDLTIGHNNSLTSIESLNNLDTIGGDMIIVGNDVLPNLTGLNSLVSVDNMTISGNEALENFVGLENLSVVNEFSNQYNTILQNFTGLNGLDTIRGSLRVNQNQALSNFEGLENLVSIEGGMIITENEALTNFIGLESLTSCELGLNIIDNNALLNFMGLESLNNLRGLFIEENDALVNFIGLESLTEIDGALRVKNNDDILNFEGFEGLSFVQFGLSITENDALVNLQGLGNLSSIQDLGVIQNDALISLSGLDNITINGILSVWGNPQLNFCSIQGVCEYIISGSHPQISSNAQGCGDEIEIINQCNSIPKIQTDVFYDINQNKIRDNGESSYYDAPILIEPTNNYYYVQNGNGIINIESGIYTLTIDQASLPEWQLTTDSISYYVSLQAGEIDTVAFGIYPTQQVSHIQTIINSTSMRCNEVITLEVTTKNLGTTIASGTMWLTIDDLIPSFWFIHQPDTVITNVDAYGWYFTDLYPGQSVIKNVQVTVPGPPDIELGDRLLFVSFSEFMDENGEDGSEGFRYNPEVRCSFDPNDKLVNPNREGDYVLFEEDLIYTIRFQNTGNDVAYDVVILDTLDANLDLSTFRVLGSSHANRLNTILNEDEGILTFEFRDIFLPDSTSNFEASQGYVNYLIHTIDGLAEETPVTNSAGIYFDLNPPVITNTTQSIMVSELPTVSTETPDNSFDFNILPNPNKGIFTVQNIPKGTYQIYNTSGQIIQEGNMQNDLLIDISREAQGVYFISVTIDNETIVRRIVKM